MTSLVVSDLLGDFTTLKVLYFLTYAKFAVFDMSALKQSKIIYSILQ